MAKAQMEILGLAVVIIMIIMGLIFYLKFADDPGLDKSTIENRNNADALDAILKTTVSCGSEVSSPKYQLMELIKDCYDTPPNRLCEYSCPYYYSGAKSMLHSTFDKWGKRYYFAVYDSEKKLQPGSVINDEDNPSGQYFCGSDSVGGMSSTQPIRTSRGIELTVVLKVCG